MFFFIFSLWVFPPPSQKLMASNYTWNLLLTSVGFFVLVHYFAVFQYINAVVAFDVKFSILCIKIMQSWQVLCCSQHWNEATHSIHIYLHFPIPPDNVVASLSHSKTLSISSYFLEQQNPKHLLIVLAMSCRLAGRRLTAKTVMHTLLITTQVSIYSTDCITLYICFKIRMLSLFDKKLYKYYKAEHCFETCTAWCTMTISYYIKLAHVYSCHHYEEPLMEMFFKRAYLYEALEQLWLDALPNITNGLVGVGGGAWLRDY